MKRYLKVVAFALSASALTFPVWAETPEEIAQEEELTTTGEIVNIAGEGRARFALDRDDATYTCGATATFTVTVYASDNETVLTEGEVRYSLDNYGTDIVTKETRYDLSNGNPFTVSGALNYPGFLRLTVKGTDENGKLVSFGKSSVAYEPEKIRTAREKPADFDSFWDNAVAELAKTDLDVKLEAATTVSSSYTRQRISFATVGGKRVYGVLCKPLTPGTYPLVVACPGAGSGYNLSLCPGDATRVYLYMSIHSFPIPDTAAEAEELYAAQEAYWKGVDAKSRSRAYPVGGLTLGVTQAHYYDKILGINRAIDWAVGQDFVDPACVVYHGSSQGGGMGLILAGLNKHFTRVYTGVPAMCDWSSCLVNGRQSGWPRLAEYEPQQTPEDLARIETMQLNARYFDGAYFAERITVPIRMTVGFIDESCAPHSVFAAYNALASSDKYLFQGIGGAHGSHMANQEEIKAWENEISSKTVFVDCAAPAGGNGRSWATAYRTIQEGVDAASPIVRDTVLVAPGVYDQGEPRLVKSGKKATARVSVVGKSVKIKSRDGKAVTHIVGRLGNELGGPDADGNEPVMCVFVNAEEATKNTVVEGFTIRNGGLTSDLGSVGPAGVGSPLLSGGNYSFDASNNFYVAYCTISNCCAQRASAMRGGTAIATLFTDNRSWRTGGSIENAMYIFAYNSIFTRSGAVNTANGNTYTLVNCTFANNLSGRGTASDTKMPVSIYNTAIVDNGKLGDNGVAGVYTCVGDGNADPAAAFYINTTPRPPTTIDDTVMLSTLVNASTPAQTQHQELFVAAPLGDFRPIDGGYLYGKDGHYGKIEYTNLDFIPPEYKQRDFYGNKLADDAKIPIGAILPPATVTTKPIKLEGDLTVNGVAAFVSGEYIAAESVDTAFKIGTVPGKPAISMTLGGQQNDFLPAGGFGWLKPGARERTTTAAISVTTADGVLYVDRASGSDDEGTTGTADNPFQSIQRAVDQIPAGQKYVVYVGEGTYDNGEADAVWPGSTKTIHARVALTNGLGSAYVRATGRREMTIVEGAIDTTTEDGSGANARRIVVNASTGKNLSQLVFSGFTFQKGRVDTAENDPRSQMGGGFLCKDENTLVIEDSVVTDCAASNYSCGYFTTFVRCLFKDNRANKDKTSQVLGRGIAAFCVFEDNPNKPGITQFQAGTDTSATYFSGLLNCTIYTPNATKTAGVRGNEGPLANTVVLSSARIVDFNYEKGDYSDTTSLAWGCDRVAEGLDIVVANPKLKDPANGDYRPNWNSPVWQAGTVDAKFRKYMVADFNGDPVDISADGTKVTLGAVHTVGRPRCGLQVLLK